MKGKVNEIDGGVKNLALATLILCLLLMPPVFSKLFSLFALDAGERKALLLIGLILGGCSGLVYLLSSKLNKISALKWVFLTLISLLSLELSLRLFVTRGLGQGNKEFVVHGMSAYPERWRYIGHPFLQFVGNPNYLFDPNWVNENGFFFKNISYDKKPGEIRIACMGGSTSRDYPKAMKFANENTKVLNFSLDAYTPLHSLINYEINALSYHPDYVVFHHTPYPVSLKEDGNLASVDYRDTLKTFTPVMPPDSFLIRISILYRELRNMVSPLGDWYHFRSAVILTPKSLDYSHIAKEQLIPFERELQSFVDLSRGRNIKLVLTTHPHHWQQDTAYVEMGNERIRLLHEKYKRETLLVDLDKVLSKSHSDYFEDSVHFNAQGNEQKGKLIAEAIAADIKIKSAN